MQTSTIGEGENKLAQEQLSITKVKVPVILSSSIIPRKIFIEDVRKIEEKDNTLYIFFSGEVETISKLSSESYRVKLDVGVLVMSTHSFPVLFIDNTTFYKSLYGLIFYNSKRILTKNGVLLAKDENVQTTLESIEKKYSKSTDNYKSRSILIDLVSGYTVSTLLFEDDLYIYVDVINNKQLSPTNLDGMSLNEVLTYFNLTEDYSIVKIVESPLTYHVFTPFYSLYISSRPSDKGDKLFDISSVHLEPSIYVLFRNIKVDVFNRYGFMDWREMGLVLPTLTVMMRDYNGMEIVENIMYNPIVVSLTSLLFPVYIVFPASIDKTICGWHGMFNIRKQSIHINIAEFLLEDTKKLFRHLEPTLYEKFRYFAIPKTNLIGVLLHENLHSHINAYISHGIRDYTPTMAWGEEPIVAELEKDLIAYIELSKGDLEKYYPSRIFRHTSQRLTEIVEKVLEILVTWIKRLKKHYGLRSVFVSIDHPYIGNDNYIRLYIKTYIHSHDAIDDIEVLFLQRALQTLYPYVGLDTGFNMDAIIIKTVIYLRVSDKL